MRRICLYWLLVLVGFLPVSATGQARGLEQRVERLEGRIVALEGRPASREPISSAAAVFRANPHAAWGISFRHGVILDKEFFVVSFDTLRRVPEWVSYHLTAEMLAGSAPRVDDFRADPELAPSNRAELADYRLSGFDRGHMAPAADFKRNRRAMATTFLLSNMAPQTARLNQRIWSRLEAEVRSLARAHGSIWIVTGPLYLDADGRPGEPRRWIGQSERVAVPTHFFKVILCEHELGSYETFAFILPNSVRPIAGKPQHYLRAVDAVEALAALDFFASLPDYVEDRLEAMIPTGWPIR